MNEQDHILLDAYFNGLLDEQEARALRNRVDTDPEWGAAFQLRQQMEQWLQQEPGRQAVSQTLTSVGADFFKENTSQTPLKATKVNWKRSLLLAASFALLLVATWYFGTTRPPGYGQYAIHTPLSFTERGARQTLQSAAESDFSQGNYRKALQSLNTLLQEQPDNLTAVLYKGICLIELDQTVEARNVLQPVAGGNSALRMDAQWYIALSYLKEKNLARCKEALLLIDANSDQYEQARKLLSALPE